MPGRSFRLMRKGKTSNPLFCSTRAKRWSDFRRPIRRPALADVVDFPSRNPRSNDPLLAVDYDLSSVMFITTANTLPYTNRR